MTSVIRGSDDFDSSALLGMIRLNTPNGYGATNTKIGRYVNSSVVGVDMSYADSASLGGAITILKTGTYSFTGQVSFTAGATAGLSLNTATPTVNISSLPYSEILASATYTYVTLAWTGRLTAGDVVRLHTDGATFLSSLFHLTASRVR